MTKLNLGLNFVAQCHFHRSYSGDGATFNDMVYVSFDPGRKALG